VRRGEAVLRSALIEDEAEVLQPMKRAAAKSLPGEMQVVE
jgi:hypothetical protein